MRDDKAGSVFGQFIHRLLNHDLGSRIDRRGGFVKNQHRCILQHGACNGQKLLLPGRNGSALGQNRIQAMRQGTDKFIDSARACRPHNILVGHMLHAVCQVLANRPFKQPGVLQNHAEHSMNILAPNIVNRSTVNRNTAAVDFKKAHQQIDHGCFPGTGRSDNRNLLSRLYIGTEILDYGAIRAFGIGKTHVVKHNLSSGFTHGMRFFVRFILQLLRLQKVENATCSRRGGLQIGHALRNLGQGRSKQTNI